MLKINTRFIDRYVIGFVERLMNNCYLICRPSHQELYVLPAICRFNNIIQYRKCQDYPYIKWEYWGIM